jgi:hypothetical protein
MYFSNRKNRTTPERTCRADVWQQWQTLTLDGRAMLAPTKQDALDNTRYRMYLCNTAG